MKTPIQKMSDILLALSMLSPRYRFIAKMSPEVALTKINSWEELNFYYDKICREKYIVTEKCSEASQI